MTVVKGSKATFRSLNSGSCSLSCFSDSFSDLFCSQDVFSSLNPGLGLGIAGGGMRSNRSFTSRKQLNHCQFTGSWRASQDCQGTDDPGTHRVVNRDGEETNWRNYYRGIIKIQGTLQLTTFLIRIFSSFLTLTFFGSYAKTWLVECNILLKEWVFGF